MFNTARCLPRLQLNGDAKFFGNLTIEQGDLELVAGPSCQEDKPDNPPNASDPPVSSTCPSMPPRCGGAQNVGVTPASSVCLDLVVSARVFYVCVTDQRARLFVALPSVCRAVTAHAYMRTIMSSCHAHVRTILQARSRCAT